MNQTFYNNQTKSISYLTCSLVVLVSSASLQASTKDVEEEVKYLNRSYDKTKDLYYQEFNSMEEAEQANKKNCCEEEIESSNEKIIGSEDRRNSLGLKVQQSRYNFNFYLEIYYKNASDKVKTYYGSAIAIAPNLLLTAGHNLYDPVDGGYPYRIDYFGACHKKKVLEQGTISPTQLMKDSGVFVHPEYVKSENFLYQEGKARNIYSSFDIGLIILEKSLEKATIANVLSPMTLSSSELDYIKKKKVRITGYPEKREAYTMKGDVLEFKISENEIHYDIDTARGQSGSGISFVKGKGESKGTYCIGVHTFAPKNRNEKYNMGVLIDQEIVNQIKQSITKN